MRKYFSVGYRLDRPFLTLDADQDNLLDVDELKIGTDIHKSDTDGDGFSDYIELALGHDPLSKEETPSFNQIYQSLPTKALYVETAAEMSEAKLREVVFTGQKSEFIDFTKHYLGHSNQEVRYEFLNLPKDWRKVPPVYPVQVLATYKDGSKAPVFHVNVRIAENANNQMADYLDIEVVPLTVYQGDTIDLLAQISSMDEVQHSQVIQNVGSQTAGTYTGKVEIHFTDGSAKVVEVPVIVKAKIPASDVRPIPQLQTPTIELLQGEMVNYQKGFEDFPTGAKLEIISPIDTSQTGEQTAKAKVIFENGMSRVVHLDIVVLAKAENHQETENTSAANEEIEEQESNLPEENVASDSSEMDEKTERPTQESQDKHNEPELIDEETKQANQAGTMGGESSRDDQNIDEKPNEQPSSDLSGESTPKEETTTPTQEATHQEDKASHVSDHPSIEQEDSHHVEVPVEDESHPSNQEVDNPSTVESEEATNEQKDEATPEQPDVASQEDTSETSEEETAKQPTNDRPLNPTNPESNHQTDSNKGNEETVENNSTTQEATNPKESEPIPAKEESAETEKQPNEDWPTTIEYPISGESMDENKGNEKSVASNPTTTDQSSSNLTEEEKAGEQATDENKDMSPSPVAANEEKNVEIKEGSTEEQNSDYIGEQNRPENENPIGLNDLVDKASTQSQSGTTVNRQEQTSVKETVWQTTTDVSISDKHSFHPQNTRMVQSILQTKTSDVKLVAIHGSKVSSTTTNPPTNDMETTTNTKAVAVEVMPPKVEHSAEKQDRKQEIKTSSPKKETLSKKVKGTGKKKQVKSEFISRLSMGISFVLALGASLFFVAWKRRKK